MNNIRNLACGGMKKGKKGGSKKPMPKKPVVKRGKR